METIDKPTESQSSIAAEVISDEELDELYDKALRRRFIWGFIAGVIITALLFLMNAGSIASFVGVNDLGGTTAVVGRTTGEVALSATELAAEITTAGVTAYWTGPEDGYKYALTISPSKQVFIRYLPTDAALTDTAKRYRVVATYPVADAYNITAQAGQLPGAVSLTNSDGAMVYYSQEAPNNVYAAFQGIDYEIEVFDPTVGVALSLVTTPGKVQRVG